MGEELTIIRKPVPAIAPTMRDLLAVLFRQRRLALVSFMAIFMAVLGYGVFAPTYQAHMSVLVRRGRVDPLVTPAPTPSPMFQRDEITEEELNSQVELLHDDEILRTVVQTPGLIAKPWYERFLGGSEDVRLARSVRRLTRQLTVEPIRKTNLIQVDYSSSDPAQAAAVLHALAHAYLERQQRVRRPSGEYQFFEQQVAQSRRGLLDAEFRLMDFSSDQGVVSAAQERDMALQKLSDAEANDHQNQVAMAETRQRIRDLQVKLQSLPAAHLDHSPQRRQSPAGGKDEIETAGIATQAHRTPDQIRSFLPAGAGSGPANRGDQSQYRGRGALAAARRDHEPGAES